MKGYNISANHSFLKEVTPFSEFLKYKGVTPFLKKIDDVHLIKKVYFFVELITRILESPSSISF